MKKETVFIREPFRNCRAKDPTKCPYHSQFTPFTLGDRTWDDLFNRIDREVVKASRTVTLEDVDKNLTRFGEYRKIQESFFETLTSDERYALHRYGDERGADKITYALTRFGKPLEEYHDDFTKKQIPLIDGIFAKQTLDTTPKLVYRGMTQLPYSDKINKNGVITFKNFVSTSLSPRVALTFAEKDTPVLLEIETRQGIPAVLMLGEYEYLLPRNNRFKVLDIEENVTCLVPRMNNVESTAGVTLIKLQDLGSD